MSFLRSILLAFCFLALTLAGNFLKLFGADPMDLKFRKKGKKTFLKSVKKRKKQASENIAPDTIYPLW
jgi:hypothetical protein